MNPSYTTPASDAMLPLRGGGKIQGVYPMVCPPLLLFFVGHHSGMNGLGDLGRKVAVGTCYGISGKIHWF